MQHHRYRGPAEPTTKPDRLVIRIWSGDQQQVYAETAGKTFTEATGIPIVWDTTDEAVSYAKLNQEISSGQPPSADASFNAQQRAYTNAARGWTIPINPALAPNLAKVTAETAAPADKRGALAYVNPYTLSVPFIVRTDKIDPNQVKLGMTCSSLTSNRALRSTRSTRAPRSGSPNHSAWNPPRTLPMG